MILISDEITNKDVLSPQRWLAAFLTRRNLTEVTNSPLYSYHVTAAEYISLKLCLQTHNIRYTTASPSKQWCAIYTLYCAEWFRREYINGWSWSGIWETLGFELTPSQIRETVLTGLESNWHRPVVQFQNENNSYLGSVFSEGGLPLKLLEDRSSHFKSVFQRVLMKYHFVTQFESTIHDLVRVSVKSLPEPLQSETTIKLIVEMTDKLMLFVSRYELDKKTDPAAELDQSSPNWREAFPLPLDAQSGTDFLNGLLCAATFEVKKSSKKIKFLACSHILSLANQSIKTEVTLPPKLIFTVSKQQLSTSRVELAVFEGDQQLADLGSTHVQFDDGRAFIRIRHKSVSLKRHRSEAELYLAITQAGQILSRKLIDHSSIAVGEAPVGFVFKNDEWRYAGQASFKIKSNELLVILPKGAICEHMEENVYEEVASYLGFAVIKFCGTLNVKTTEDERYLIKSNAEANAADQLLLTGEQITWRSTPTMVFKGVPEFCWAQPELEESKQFIQMYFGNERANTLNTVAKYGQHRVSVRNTQNEILLRKPIGVLPSDYTIQIVSGSSPLEGLIRIQTQSRCISTITAKGVKTRNCKTDNGLDIYVTSDGLPPANITLKVLANLESDPIYIELPFPVNGAVAYNATGDILDREVTIESLLGCRLYLFAQESKTVHYQLEATLKGTGANYTDTPYYKWNYCVKDKPVDISLYSLKTSVEELMALKADIDVTVELRITNNRSGNALTIGIKKYATMLEHDKTYNTVYLPESHGTKADSIKPVLMRISEPERHLTFLQSKLSQGAVTGQFELPHNINQSGPWLVIPAKNSEVNFRAKFIVGTANDTEIEHNVTLKTLQKAVMAYHPIHNSQAIAAVIEMMAQDAGHSGWLYLKSLFDNFGHLPMPTFQVWNEVINNNQALCLACFHFECRPNFLSSIESSYPIFWEFIAIKDWLHAKALMGSWFGVNNLPCGLIDKQLNKILNQLGDLIPSYAGDYVNYLQTKIFPVVPSSAIMQSIIRDSWYQSLLQQHADDEHWPEHFGYGLAKWINQQDAFALSIPTSHSYQNAVVYLPIFSACVAVGVIDKDSIFKTGSHAAFHLRKLRDFDSEWFEPLYRYALFQLLNKDI